MAACANCGNEISPGLKFCTSCGKPVAAAAPPPVVAVGRTCRWCGEAVPEAVKFCIKCGKPLQEAAPRPMTAPPPPLAPPAPIAAAPPPPPPSRPPVFASGGLGGPQEPHPAPFALPPGPPPGPQKTAAGTIVAVLIVLTALGAGGYYGYSKWKANSASPQAVAVPAPPTANQVPPANTEPAAPPPAQPQPAQEPAAIAANPAPRSAPQQNDTPAASVPKQRVQPKPVRGPESEAAPLHDAQPAKTPPVPSEPATSPNPIRVGGNVQQAQLIRQIPPVYPPIAKSARISGTVRLRVVVGTDGAVKDVTPISGHPLLTKAATDAVSQWIYKPTVLNGQPVEVVTEVAINFTLSQ